jgi:hypothetical protein
MDPFAALLNCIALSKLPQDRSYVYSRAEEICNSINSRAERSTLTQLVESLYNSEQVYANWMATRGNQDDERNILAWDVMHMIRTCIQEVVGKRRRTGDDEDYRMEGNSLSQRSSRQRVSGLFPTGFVRLRCARCSGWVSHGLC